MRDAHRIFFCNDKGNQNMVHKELAASISFNRILLCPFFKIAASPGNYKLGKICTFILSYLLFLYNLEILRCYEIVCIHT